jgi:uncharacterized membrane protein
MTVCGRHGSVLLLGAVVGLSGCAEHVRIRSGPSRANVAVNGTPIGITPVDYSVSRSDLDKPYEVRVEKDGYEPVTTTLRTRLAKGRVTGAFFTLGILWAFRSMYYIEPVFAQLKPVAAPTAEQDRLLGESLRNLRELHQRGEISDEEFRRRQQEMLRSP